jgi:hypothetical protein
MVKTRVRGRGSLPIGYLLFCIGFSHSLYIVYQIFKIFSNFLSLIFSKGGERVRWVCLST